MTASRFMRSVVGLAFILALGFGARQATASARLEDCQDTCPDQKACDSFVAYSSATGQVSVCRLTPACARS